MAMTAQHLAPQLDEISDVLRCVGHAPRWCTPQGWRLDRGPDAWRLLVNRTDNARTAGHHVLLGAGLAAEYLVVALEARQHRVEVSELPPEDPRVVIAVRVVGHAHPSALMTTLRDHALEPAPQLPGPGRLITASDLRVLSLTAEARCAEIRWPGTDGPPHATLLTRGDTPEDRVHAGRALGRLLLRAAALGLDARAEPDGHLPLPGSPGSTPQAQFTLT
jgi:hypothetical protein